MKGALTVQAFKKSHLQLVWRACCPLPPWLIHGIHMCLLPSIAQDVILDLSLAKAGKLLKLCFLWGSEGKAYSFPVETLWCLGFHQPGAFGNISCPLSCTNQQGSQIPIKAVRQESTLLLSNLGGESKFKPVQAFPSSAEYGCLDSA